MIYVDMMKSVMPFLLSHDALRFITPYIRYATAREVLARYADDTYYAAAILRRRGAQAGRGAAGAATRRQCYARRRHSALRCKMPPLDIRYDASAFAVS